MTKEEFRKRLIISAIQGTATATYTQTILVRNAIQMADEVIKQLEVENNYKNESFE